MKQLKTVIALSGLAGIIATFLPYFTLGDQSMTFWSLSHSMSGGANAGLLNGPNQVFVALACFAVPMLMGLLALATKELARWEAVIATLFSLAAFGVEGVRKGMSSIEGMGTSYGAKLLFVAAAIGFVAAFIGIAKPDKRRI